MNRRDCARLTAAAALVQWLPRQAQAAPALADYPFALGVASGAADHASVVLWTRLAPGALRSAADQVTVRWELAHDAQFQRLVQSGQATAHAALGHSVHVEPTSLQSDRWFYYRFMLGDAVSPVGRTRTLAAPDAVVAQLRLAYASCQKWEDGYFSAWRHMRAHDVDAVVFLGDYLYEYPGTSSRVRVPTGGWVVTLEDYRARYALYKSDPDLQSMHAAAPWFMTWDDHEVQNDYASLQAGDSGTYAPVVADFPARRAAAYQAYYENMPLRANVLTAALAGLGTGAEMRLYSQVQFGRLAGLSLLDARQYKDPQVCNPGDRAGSSMVDPGRCAAWSDPRRSLLGAAQERWLDTRMNAARHATTWNLLGQQTLFGQRNTGTAERARLWNDGWDGYAGARRRLTDSLQRHAVPNAVVLGGDVHENWVGQVKADYTRADSAALGVEFCGTSITSHSGKGDRTQSQLANNPHFVFADSQYRGYGIAEFTPQRLRVSLQVLDDVTRKDAAVRTLAAFEVPAGRPVIEAV